MRPVPARWFELLTSREDLGGILDLLARSGSVQLETYSDVTQPETLPELKHLVQEYAGLADRYEVFWPAPEPPSGGHGDTDIRAGTEVLDSLRAWSHVAEPLVSRSHSLAREKSTLALISHWLSCTTDEGLPDLHALAGAGPAMAARLYVLPSGTWPTTASPSLLLHKTEGQEVNFLLVLGTAAQVKLLDETMHGLKARAVAIPPWLPAHRQQALEAIQERLGNIKAQEGELALELDKLSSSTNLPEILAKMQFLKWVVEKVPQMAMTEHFAWVTGWTSDVTGTRLDQQLERSGLNYLVRYPPAPERAISPMILRNPVWARPFEVFGRLLGTPSASETDPSTILALVAPLMFGYMFGDLGQGAVLVCAGLLWRKRFPALSLLIPGGMMAMVFGLLFGSVFANESILPALWLRPLEQPLPVLGLTLLLGAILITLGMCLDGIQARWAGHGWVWWRSKAGLLVAYLGLVGIAVKPAVGWLALAGCLWFLLGATLPGAGGALKRMGSALGELLETLLQLLVNTISFIRVGAFALAHSGLAVAVSGIAESFSSVSARVAVFVLGNLFILLLEGLVVGIQATRLVLFEFFIRFLRAEGREFHPLSAQGEDSKRQSRRAS